MILRTTRAALALCAVLLATPLGAYAQAIPMSTPTPTPTITPTTTPSPTPSAMPSVPAGVIPASVDITLAGGVSQAFVLAQIQAAIARAAQLQPGAQLTVAPPTLPSTFGPGTLLATAVAVHVAGGGVYADVDATTQVQLHIESLGRFDPSLLLYSDDPEYVSSDGVLFRQHSTIDVGNAARAYIYHASRTSGLRLFLVLQAISAPSRVQIVGNAYGPSLDYGCVGHSATAQYLRARASAESLVATTTPDAPFVLPLDMRAMAPQELVTAVEDVRVLDGGPVRVVVVAASAGVDPRTLLAQPPLPSDGHGRSGEFALRNVAPLTLAYTAGSNEDSSVTVGMGAKEGTPDFPNLLAGGRPLAGDYGVVRPVVFQLANPTATEQTVYLNELASSGAATTSIWFDGDPAPTEVPPARNPSTPYLVKAFALAPGERRTVTGVYMTDGASAYPIELTFTPTPAVSPPPSTCIPAPS